MRLPALAFSSVAAAVLLMVAASIPPVMARWAVPAVLTGLLLIFAWGWPRLLGAPSRRSLSATIAVPAVVVVWAVTLLEDRWNFSNEVMLGDRPDLWLAPVAAATALGTMVGFVVQVLRGQGRPFRLESTASTVTGVAIGTSASAWALLIRTQTDAVTAWFETGADLGALTPTGGVSEIPVLTVSLLAGTVAAALIGLLPTTLPVRVFVMVVVAGALPLGVYSGLNQGEIHYVATLAVAGVLSGALVGLIRAAVEQEQDMQAMTLIDDASTLVTDEPLTAEAASGARRGELIATLSLGAAPVLVSGMVLYFTLWVVPPLG
ncbi:hypothetical protein [Citricoccus muralis]|uniref:Uncharacterized protein n=1 Tax=Citricoccus muralis TaxID=169134 RepID=A0ABY8H4Y2_9MICC|nr:hypothetical protein [Citricoccus muralis]WFP15899.1 hypothetical protein P8192_10905 [Citricoccus muralis]